MDMVNLLVPPLIVADALTGVELKWRLVAGALSVGILIFGALPYAEPIPPYPGDLMEVAEFLREQPGEDWRFVVHPGVSHHSYLPVLTGKSTLNGWYHEGDPAEEGHLRMWYALSTGNDASLYLKIYAAKFLMASINVTVKDYSRIERIGNYWIYTSNVSFVEPVGGAVLLGNFYDLPVDYAYFEDPSNLAAIPPGSVGVVYAGNPSKEEEDLLWNFVRNGGTVVWVPEGGADASLVCAA